MIHAHPPPMETPNALGCILNSLPLGNSRPLKPTPAPRGKPRRRPGIYEGPDCGALFKLGVPPHAEKENNPSHLIAGVTTFPIPEISPTSCPSPPTLLHGDS